MAKKTSVKKSVVKKTQASKSDGTVRFMFDLSRDVKRQLDLAKVNDPSFKKGTFCDAAVRKALGMKA